MGEPVRFLGLPGKGANAEDSPMSYWGGDFLAEATTPSLLILHAVECHSKSRGPEAGLKPVDAPFPSFHLQCFFNCVVTE